MPPIRSTDTDVNVVVERKVSLMWILGGMSVGAVFLGGLLITLVLNQASQNQTTQQIQRDVTETKGNVQTLIGNMTLATIKQNDLDSTIKAIDRRLTQTENKLESLRSNGSK